MSRDLEDFPPHLRPEPAAIEQQLPLQTEEPPLPPPPAPAVKPKPAEPFLRRDVE